MFRRRAVRAALAVGLAAVAAGAAPAVSRADVDPAGCTQSIGYNTNVKTWESYFADGHNASAVLPFGAGTTGAGGGAPRGTFDGAGSPPTGRNTTAVIYDYFDGMVALTADATKNDDGTYKFPYQVIKKPIGTSANGKPYNFYVVGTRQNMANLDSGANDSAFWRGVREGTISTDDGLDAAGSRPAFAWVTATPHGDESAAGESISRELYELLARTDCENAHRVQVMDLFLMPVRNPDGHDAVTRTTAWGFDPNRDFGTQNQQENGLFVPLMNQYPGVFFIDAHQQGGRAYFFPPNEDPVHHEISSFSLGFIQNTIGPALQNAFNDQSDYYQNYNEYDLFTPEYGDTVPSLLMGAAGMTYEKGNANIYSRQIYDHYLAIDTTINVTANDKVNILSGWVKQWGEAVQQGANCQLQQNSLVSPLHDHIQQQPQGTVCGYFFKPTEHAGDTASMINLLQKTGVRVFKLNTPVKVNGYHEYGQTYSDGSFVKPIPATPDYSQFATTDNVTLPAGTLWIPLNQGTKHWIDSLLEENPWIPYSYFYDVVTWSYPLQRGLAGSGFLTQQMPAGMPMTEIHGASLGTFPSTASSVYAFNTDSMQALGLVSDLLDKGVNVYRGGTGFTAGGTQFYTGAALVDASTLAGKADLAALAAARNTPITGLSNFPVAHYQMTMPKIGVYTGSAAIPSNPLYRGTGNGHCGTSGGGNFCTALFTLRVKDNISADQIVPVTSNDLSTLVSQKFTALISGVGLTTGTFVDPTKPTCDTWTINANGTALQAFVNAGGIFIGNGSSGTTTARCLFTPIVTTSISGLITPGSTFDSTVNVTNPVAWGFDLGAFIYRESNGDPIYDGTKFPAGTTFPLYYSAAVGKQVGLDQSGAIAYGADHYGYEVNAAGLASTPAIADVPVGAGHVVLIGYDAFYRAWKEQDERFVLNAALYPRGTAQAATEPTAETAAPAPAAVAPAAKALSQAKLAKTVSKDKTTATKTVTRDVLISVKKADSAKLKTAVKAAKLSKAVRRKVSYKSDKKSVTLVVKGARTSDEHARQQWVSRIQKGLAKLKVKPLYGLV